MVDEGFQIFITRRCFRSNTDCLSPRVRAISPAGLGLGLYPHPVPAMTSTSSVSTSAGGLAAGLNAAATELARLSDRAAAAAASVVPASGLTQWTSLSSFTAAGVDTPNDRLCRLDADDQNKNFDDYLNKQRSVKQPSMARVCFCILIWVGLALYGGGLVSGNAFVSINEVTPRRPVSSVNGVTSWSALRRPTTRSGPFLLRQCILQNS